MRELRRIIGQHLRLDSERQRPGFVILLNLRQRVADHVVAIKRGVRIEQRIQAENRAQIGVGDDVRGQDDAVILFGQRRQIGLFTASRVTSPTSGSDAMKSAMT